MKRNSAIMLTKIQKDLNDERKDEENNAARLEYTCHIADDTLQLTVSRKGSLRTTKESKRLTKKRQNDAWDLQHDHQVKLHDSHFEKKKNDHCDPQEKRRDKKQKTVVRAVVFPNFINSSSP